MKKLTGKLGGIAFHQLQVDIGKPFLVERQYLGQNHPAAGVGDSDGQLADGEILDICQFPVGFLLECQKLARLAF